MTRTRSMIAGYVLLGLLALSDALTFLAAGSEDAPPAFVVVLGTVLGLVTLAGLVAIARTRRRAQPAAMVVTVAASRALSAVLGIPAFFVDIEAGTKVAVGVSILLTVAGLALVRADVADARAAGTSPRLA